MKRKKQWENKTNRAINGRERMEIVATFSQIGLGPFEVCRININLSVTQFLNDNGCISVLDISYD
jgi:hypothetical protein